MTEFKIGYVAGSGAMVFTLYMFSAIFPMLPLLEVAVLIFICSSLYMILTRND